VSLHQSFETASQGACERVGPAAFRIAIEPEVSEINPSPWYAFAVESREAGPVQLTLDYGDHRHRYSPWLRQGEQAWSRLAADRIEIAADGSSARFDLDLAPGRTLIAAQPVVDTEDAAALADRLADRYALDIQEIGRSVEARPIMALVSSTIDPGADWLVFLGRQHPPEIPGTYAFEAFVEAVLAAGGGYNIIAIPLLNPDGVSRGYWRTNLAGVDLNRDWGIFSQPETRAAMAAVEALVPDRERLAAVVDFHATHADRLYIPPPASLDADSRALMEAWLGALAEQLSMEDLEVRETSRAANDTAKGHFVSQWRTLAVTWEVGDTTSREEARREAVLGAEALLNALANTAPDTSTRTSDAPEGGR
jgi:hypothetical protein